MVSKKVLVFLVLPVMVALVGFLGMHTSSEVLSGNPTMAAFKIFQLVNSSAKQLYGLVTPPPLRVFPMLTGALKFQAIYAATKLNVADHLAKGPLSVSKLAKACDIPAHNEDNLYRVLRALTYMGMFKELPNKSFENNESSDMLRADFPDTIRYLVLHFGQLYGPWGEFMHSLTKSDPSDNSAKKYFGGKDIWEWLTENPEENEIFDMAMTGLNLLSQGIVTTYDFSNFNTVADIGGGKGSLLELVMKRNPAVKGILFDREIVIENAKQLWESKKDMKDRIELVSGSFFTKVPQADAYLLRMIIHDWDDESSIAILKTIRKAIPKHGKVLLVENLVGKNVDLFETTVLDLNMMTMLNGKERTQEQFEQLFKASGFKLQAIHNNPSPFFIIEAVPV